MALKGLIQPDHIPVNKYQLLVAGVIPITFTSISGIEDDLDIVDLPDRTKASGGNTKAFEFTAKVPQHHTAEVAAIEIWFAEGQDPILPTYKKFATLVQQSGSGFNTKSYTILGCFISKLKFPDLEMSNEGEMGEIEVTFQADQRLPI